MAHPTTRPVGKNPDEAPTPIRDSVAGLDRIVHSVAQTHLDEYLPGARGPYPGHPHGDDAHRPGCGRSTHKDRARERSDMDTSAEVIP